MTIPMSRAREFLYLVVERSRHPLQSLYTVHRIPPWSLFFSDKDGGQRRRPQAEEAPAELMEGRLSPPIVTLYPSAGDLPMNFVLFGRGRDKIAATDHLGRAFLYDDALRAVSALPSANEPMHAPLSIAVGDDVYFFSNPPGVDDGHVLSVEALADETYWSRRSEMHWRYAPAPPYVKQQPKVDRETDVYDGAIDAYTLVGEWQLWVSAAGYGTYSMDAKKISYGIGGNEVRHGEWTKVGDWAMPFSGRAFFAPEHRLWFGFSERDQSVLCAADLKEAAAAGRPPVVSHEWEGFAVPCQAAVRSFLLHLGTGDGRFCVAKFSHDENGRGVAMLTGVEVARCLDSKALRLIKHKTYRYGELGEDDNPVCLL